MKARLVMCITSLFLSVFVVDEKAWSWNENTHNALSAYAAETSFLNTSNYLTLIGCEKGLKQELASGTSKKAIIDWIQDGASYE